MYLNILKIYVKIIKKFEYIKNTCQNNKKI